MIIPNETLKAVIGALLANTFPKLEKSVSEKLVKGFYSYFPGYEIIATKRIVAFIAQAAHETGGFKWFYELGRKNYFNKYEPKTSLGKKLGNTQIGDGYRFRGRGIFHLTGRYNYLKYSKLIGLDLIQSPDIAADPIVACQIACEYWKQNQLNPLADDGNFREITRRINGGYSGWIDRLRYYDLLTAHLEKLII